MNVDIRALALAGLFILTIYILTLLAAVPNLSKDELFSVLSTAIISGSFGSAVGFYFGQAKKDDKEPPAP